ncbi:MAG: hypothetical protein ACI4F9_10250 [Lachnospiraceae bacterium]
MYEEIKKVDTKKASFIQSASIFLLFNCQTSVSTNIDNITHKNYNKYAVVETKEGKEKKVQINRIFYDKDGQRNMKQHSHGNKGEYTQNFTFEYEGEYACINLYHTPKIEIGYGDIVKIHESIEEAIEDKIFYGKDLQIFTNCLNTVHFC